jgi:hypothetical protein
MQLEAMVELVMLVVSVEMVHLVLEVMQVELEVPELLVVPVAPYILEGSLVKVTEIFQTLVQQVVP